MPGPTPASSFVKASHLAPERTDWVELWTQAVETDLCRYLRGAASPAGVIQAIGQGGEGAAWVVAAGSFAAIGVTFGQDCVAIRWDDARGFVRYVQVGPTQYTENGALRPMPHSVDGFREVHPDGRIDFGVGLITESRYDGQTFWRRTLKDGWVVGQAGKGIGFLHEASHHFWSFGGMRLAESIHFTVIGGRMVVCAATEHGAMFRVFDAPYPPHEPPAAAPPVVVTPVPDEPHPGVPPMEVPDKSAFAAAFLGPRLALVGSMEDTRAHTFEAVNAGCRELHETDGRWGLLEKTGGDRVRERAADIWLYDLGNGTAQVVDVVSNGEGAPNDAGVRTAPKPGWGVKDIRPISQWKAPYSAGGDVPVTPEPWHAYNGGDNDTGECDVIVGGTKCNQARSAAVHRAPTPGTPPPVGQVGQQRADTAAIAATLQGAIAALARIAPDRPEAPPPPPPQVIEVDRPHPSYDEAQAMVEAARVAYGRRILPPSLAAHLTWRFLLEGYSSDQLVEDARERGRQ